MGASTGKKASSNLQITPTRAPCFGERFGKASLKVIQRGGGGILRSQERPQEGEARRLRLRRHPQGTQLSQQQFIQSVSTPGRLE